MINTLFFLLGFVAGCTLATCVWIAIAQREWEQRNE